MKFKILLISLFALLVVSGCGGGGGNDTIKTTTTTTITDKNSGGDNTNSSSNKEITMVKNKPYQIDKGDKIVKKAANTIVNIIADTKNKTTIATLKEGKAVIVKNK